MIDPNLQDAYEDDLKTIQYNKSIEQEFPVVKRDPAFFDAFIQNEYPEIHEIANEFMLYTLHRGVLMDKYPGEHNPFKDCFDNECWEEVERRVTGMNIHEAASFLPHYDEITDREAREMEAEHRLEKIAQKQKEYFEDIGMFFEFIQSMNLEDIAEYEAIHRNILNGWFKGAGIKIGNLFSDYCEEKAVSEVDLRVIQ